MKSLRKNDKIYLEIESSFWTSFSFCWQTSNQNQKELSISRYILSWNRKFNKLILFAYLLFSKWKFIKGEDVSIVSFFGILSNIITILLFYMYFKTFPEITKSKKAFEKYNFNERATNYITRFYYNNTVPTVNFMSNSSVITKSSYLIVVDLFSYINTAILWFCKSKFWILNDCK